MKRILYKHTTRGLSLPLLLLASLTLTASAQYLISSKAGFVNLVEGKAHIQRSNDAAGDKVKATLGTQLKDGDRLTTAANGYVELLLSPGSYLRLSEKTEVAATNTSLAQTRFDVVQGTAIVEVGEIDKKAPVEIGTPRGVISIAKSGIYRFDVHGEEVLVGVRRGELFLGSREQLLAKTATKIKDGKSVRLVASGAPELAKLSPKVFDDFDVWSYQRAQTLVAGNYSLLSRNQRWGRISYGWVFDPFTNAYTYLPRSMYYASPYGFGFFRSWVDCGYCSPFMYYYPGSVIGGQTTGGGGGATTPRHAIGDEGRRTSIRRDAAPGRQIEPYSRPTAVYPSHTESYDPFSASQGTSRIGDSPRAISPSSPSVAPSAPRGDSGAGRGSTGSTRGGSGRGVQ
jgi:hypothetical protein